MSDKLGLDELFDFQDNKQIQAATRAINALEKAYTKFASNITGEAIRIGQAQQPLLKILEELNASLGRVTLTNEQGKAKASALVAEVDRQTNAFKKLKDSQKGAEVANKAVEGSLEALRQKLKADREELVKLGNAATPEQLKTLSGSILDTKNKAEQLERAVRGVNSVFTAAKGSYNALTAENRELMVELRNLGGTFDANGKRTADYTAKESALRNRIAQNTTTLQKYDAELNQHFRNVGNYANSIVEAITRLKQERTALLEQEAALVRSAAATNLSADVNNRLQKELGETRAKLASNATELRSVGVETGKTGGFFKNAGAELKSFAIQTAIATFGLTAIAAGLSTAFQNNLKYSDSIANVRKTTGLGIDAAEQYATALKSINGRTSLDDLLKIGAIGGQLGIAKKELEGFTRSIDIAAVALSDDFGGGAEQVATELGKIDAIFKLSAKEGVAKSITDIGSALNELGASGAATAPFISDYALRVGAIAKNAGLGIDKVFGMGAALEELGFTAEVAGTATNKLLSGLAGNSGKFYSIARLADASLTLKEFKNLINNDVSKALELFLKGLNKGGTATTDFAELIQSLKIKGSSTTAVLTALAKNTELVGEKQGIANTALREGTSLADEAAIKNNTLAGAYEKVKNAIVNVTTGNGLFAKALRKVFEATAALINGTTVLGVSTGKSSKAVDDFGAVAISTARATLDASTANDKLLTTFTALSSATNRSGGQQAQLRKTVLDLKQALGDSTVTLNTQTGQYELNTGAVAKAIQAKRTEALEAVKTLAQRSIALQSQAQSERALSKATEEEVANRIKTITAGGVTLERLEQERAKREQNKTPGAGFAQRDTSITDAQIDAFERLDKANDASATHALKAKQADEERTKIQKQLTAAGFSLQFQTDLLREAEIKKNESTREGAEDDKAAAKAARELAKAQSELAQSEYELAKFRAEQKEKKFERQAGNEANPEEFRVDAAEKAADQRKVIANLELQEKLRLAKEEASKLVGGDDILRIKRQLISEQYAARVAEIERDLTKEQLGIHKEAISQLAEVDKFRLETENGNLQKLIDNESAGFAIRTEAQKRFAANVILLANLAYQAELRNANGNVQKIKLALDKLREATGAANDSVKPFDSKVANDESNVDKTKALIQLEKDREAHANGIVDERAYQKEKQRIENEFTQYHLTNTQVELDGTKQALDEELEYRKNINEQELEEERRKQEEKFAIIQAGAELLMNIGSAVSEVYTAGLDNDLAALSKQKDNELAMAGDNAKAKQKIEADFDREQAKIKRKQAVAAKAAALFEIALQTGIAVAKAVAESPLTFGLPWSGFALANGVIQAALVLAKPIPAFAKGTESSPAGPALVGEKGPELLEHGGRTQLVSKPSIVMLKGGTKVYTAEKTAQYFRDNAMTKTMATGYVESGRAVAPAVAREVSALDVARVVGREMGGKFEALEHAVRSQPGFAVSMDKNGVHAYVTEAGITTEYFNKRYHRKS